MKKLNNAVFPVVKWAGGKSQLQDELISRLPQQYGTYYEPFCGSAALYLALEPRCAVLNDANTELINLYIQIRDNLDSFIVAARKYENAFNLLKSKEERHDYYYYQKKRYNHLQLLKNRSNTEDLEAAALFLFLNKTCWRGVYRTNKAGLFNMAVGDKNPISLFSENNLRQVSSRFKKGTILMSGDFEICINDVHKGDLVFIDSPYYKTFDAYQKGGFSIEDHIRVFKMFNELTDRGVYCLLTNSTEKEIRDLYAKYHQEVVVAHKCVDGRPREELIITNYVPMRSNK